MTQNSLFSQEEFIEASRNFVCCRIESYESKEAQDMVRSFLDGRFENTAFCVLDPSGKERLSGTGRSPNQGLSTGRGRRGKADDGSVIAKMNQIAGKYEQRGDDKDTVLQDFHSFRQALNVASGDQRLLVFVAGSEDEVATAQTALKPVMADDQVIGKFHVDLADASSDANWTEAIENEEAKTGFTIIQSGKFGLAGKVLKQLPIDSDAAQIKAALLSANELFAQNEERKVYSEHVSAGRREGAFFDSGVPYGEDRDGDGEIDQRGPKGKGKGKGKKGPK